MNLSILKSKKAIAIGIIIISSIAIPITIFLTQSSQDIRQQAAEPKQEQKNIHGIVYIDQNRNKSLDPDEKPYPNATLYLKRKRNNSILQTITSGTNGGFLFTHPVNENIYIELASSDSYTTTTDNKIQIEAGSNTAIFSYSFGVFMAAKAAIQDKADINTNGSIDRGDMSEMIVCIKAPSECTNAKDFDLNSNGTVDAEDLNIIQRLYANNISNTDEIKIEINEALK